MITINMEKARDIQRDRIRAERAPLLQQADVAYMRALEAGDGSVADVREKKQALRDATQSPLIDAAETPEELAALTLNDIVGGV